MSTECNVQEPRSIVQFVNTNDNLISDANNLASQIYGLLVCSLTNDECDRKSCDSVKDKLERQNYDLRSVCEMLYLIKSNIEEEK